MKGRGESDRVVIDTSVWIDYFRMVNTEVIHNVEFLLDHDRVVLPKVVLAELLQGAKEKNELNQLKTYFSPLHFLSENDLSWEKAGQLSFDLKKKGATINLIDCYIAVIAEENGSLVYSFDKHFQLLRRYRGVRLFERSEV